AMRDEEVCRYLAWEPPTSLDDTLALIRDAKDAMARGQSIVYAQVWNATGRAIGSTRLLDVRPADRQVEIGATFLAREFWRPSAVCLTRSAPSAAPPRTDDECADSDARE